MLGTHWTIREMILAALGLMILSTLAIGIMGLIDVMKVSQTADTASQTNRCRELFYQIQSNAPALSDQQLENLSGPQAAGNWKKAKDKFLSEIRKLSQTRGLGEKERQLIQSIEEAWKNYDISFQWKTLANNTTSSLTNLSILAEQAHTRTVQNAKLHLLVATILGGLLSVLLSLWMVRQVGYIVRSLIHHLTATAGLRSTLSYDEMLNSQNRQLREIIDGLNSLMGEKEPDDQNTKTPKSM